MKYERLTKRDENQGRAYRDECFGCESYHHCDDCPINDSVWERLAELEDKIEQGTLIELPCKVGDTVYVIPHIRDMKGRFVGEINKRKADAFYVIGGFVDIEDDVVGEFYRIGEEVFLTREEAEKRLKELQNG